MESQNKVTKKVQFRVFLAKYSYNSQAGIRIYTYILYGYSILLYTLCKITIHYFQVLQVTLLGLFC